MSPRPRFAAVVTLHETQEIDARRRLGDLERRRVEITERIAGLLNQRHSAAAAVTLGARDQLTRYWVHIEAQVRQLQEGLGRLEKELTAAQAVLTEAHRNVAIFHKLQERDAVERARHLERLDARRLEEFAARRFNERQAAMVIQQSAIQQSAIQQSVTQQSAIQQSVTQQSVTRNEEARR